MKRKCNREVKSGNGKKLANNAKKNSKMLYAYVNSKKVVKENIRALNDENGKKVEDPAEIVRILNHQFKSVFEVDNGEKPEFSREKRAWGNLADVSEGVIIEKIMNLNEFKAFGGDKVCNLILKKSASAFVKPLKIIFDSSLSTGEVPIEWREPNVTSLFKKGSKLVRSNYRPVSLTSVICKILESIVRDHIMKYLKHYESNNVFFYRLF